jgi:hypothetical protein
VRGPERCRQLRRAPVVRVLQGAPRLHGRPRRQRHRRRDEQRRPREHHPRRRGAHGRDLGTQPRPAPRLLRRGRSAPHGDRRERNAPRLQRDPAVRRHARSSDRLGARHLLRGRRVRRRNLPHDRPVLSAIAAQRHHGERHRRGRPRADSGSRQHDHGERNRRERRDRDSRPERPLRVLGHDRRSGFRTPLRLDVQLRRMPAGRALTDPSRRHRTQRLGKRLQPVVPRQPDSTRTARGRCSSIRRGRTRGRPRCRRSTRRTRPGRSPPTAPRRAS